MLKTESKFRLAYLPLKIFVKPIIEAFWIKGVTGLDNIPKNGGAVLAANHESYFDFLCLSTVSPRPIHYLAGEVFFKNPFSRYFMNLTGQIKIERYGENRKESARNALFQAVQYLNTDQLVGIFPEGTRSSTGKLQKAYSGVVKIALLSKASIIPIGIKGTYEIMSRHDRHPRVKKICEINIGEPITFTDYYDKENDELTLESLTRTIMKKIAILSDEDYNC